MTLSVSAPSRPAHKGRRGAAPLLRRCGTAIALTAIGVIASQYLAGYGFLWSWHLDPRRATPLTIVRYWVYYGHVPVVRRRATECSGAAFALVAALGVLLAIPKSRPLHGEARFARAAEMARAGLLGAEGHI